MIKNTLVAFVVVGVLLAVGGVIGQTGIQPFSNTFDKNYTINILCKDRQTMFGCSCSKELSINWVITDYGNHSKGRYWVEYSGWTRIDGCEAGLKKNEILVYGEKENPHELIGVLLKDIVKVEYDAYNKKDLKKEPYASGKGNVK